MSDDNSEFETSYEYILSELIENDSYTKHTKILVLCAFLFNIGWIYILSNNLIYGISNLDKEIIGFFTAFIVIHIIFIFLIPYIDNRKNLDINKIKAIEENIESYKHLISVIIIVVLFISFWMMIFVIFENEYLDLLISINLFTFDFIILFWIGLYNSKIHLAKLYFKENSQSKIIKKFQPL